MPFHLEVERLSHFVKCMCMFLPACMSAPYACMMQMLSRTGIRCEPVLLTTEPALKHGGLTKQMELCALIWKLQQMKESSIAMWFWLKITHITCLRTAYPGVPKCHSWYMRQMLTLEILAE